LTVDHLLDHQRDRRSEPETYCQGNQQEGGDGPETEPEAVPYPSRRRWSCGPYLLDKALVNGWPQPLRDLVLRQGSAEQPLETIVDCHLRLTRVAGAEMLGHLVGLWRCEFPVEVEIKL
jgi:hypothetical protein